MIFLRGKQELPLRIFNFPQRKIFSPLRNLSARSLLSAITFLGMVTLRVTYRKITHLTEMYIIDPRIVMKKTTLLHSELSYAIATLGHLDTLVVADAGLPIPPETERIDLALTHGVPGAVQTLKVILNEMQVESLVLAEEVKDRNPGFLAEVQALLPGVPVEFVPHTEFKRQTSSARAVVRTGEFAPYANVILVSGVVF